MENSVRARESIKLPLTPLDINLASNGFMTVIPGTIRVNKQHIINVIKSRFNLVDMSNEWIQAAIECLEDLE